jgi:hypothetical protein
MLHPVIFMGSDLDPAIAGKSRKDPNDVTSATISSPHQPPLKVGTLACPEQHANFLSTFLVSFLLRNCPPSETEYRLAFCRHVDSNSSDRGDLLQILDFKTWSRLTAKLASAPAIGYELVRCCMPLTDCLGLAVGISNDLPITEQLCTHD